LIKTLIKKAVIAITAFFAVFVKLFAKSLRGLGRRPKVLTFLATA